ncbi:alpha/beta fold hydrolase [Paracoccus shanxieyensis]|uniref:Alpha/beta fold hydrolase n=1 Tax=Paracoccus shanxieyensis TaxID=2675752 RepID=A0A6L6IVT9_9RHOB|nr:alpha/beta hydrolase [Paracoccus shanxieyensis]MTH63402.1 alpha/beta fold hydrolase [Paracoccus shanxieyensis]MTH86323.1 alpha/beta fold hydrolase [Paracoccus shanxieyensis]
MRPAPFHRLPDDPASIARPFWLRAEDGVKLRGAHWTTGGAAGSVLLFPGRTEYVEKYDEVATQLATEGYDVIALDWRGQGMSDRLLSDPRPGHVGRFRDYQLDVLELVVAAQERALPQPWHLLAHSMGGAIGLTALQDGLPVVSAVFSAPMFGLALSPALRRLAGILSGGAQSIGLGSRAAIGSGGYEPLVLKTGFHDNLLTCDALRWGRMIREADAWPDLSIGGVTNHWLREALSECDRLAATDLPAIPTLITLGGDERIVSGAAIRQRIADWPGAQLLELAGARHEAMMERDDIRDHFMTAAIAHFQAASLAM